MNELKFKKLDYSVKNEDGSEEIKKSEAVLPVRAHDTDAGLDLYSTRITQEIDNSGKMILVYHTDLAVEIPEGYVGLLFMKSSVSKRSLMLANCVGVVDSGYIGEIMLKYKITTDAVPTIYQQGEACGQLVIMPIETPTPVFVDELSDTDRGEGGFGSTENVQEAA